MVRPDVRVGADVFAQHAWLLTADSTFLTDVFATPTPTYIHVLFVGLVPAGVEQTLRTKTDAEKKITKSPATETVPAVEDFDASWFRFRREVLVHVGAGLTFWLHLGSALS